MKRMKIVFSVLMILVILAAGCAPAPVATEAPAAPTSAPAAEQPTTAPAAKKLAFAMVTDQAGLGDQGFNDAAWEGMNKAKEDFKADISVVESREQAQYVPNFSTLAEQKTDLIVGVGFLLTNAVKEVAPLYPDTHFAVVDAVIDAPNVASLVFKENEGSYLVGAIAGMMTKTNKVGFVGGMESDLLKKFEAGYKAGVMTTNPTAEVLVSYVGSFADPAKGKEMANAQYDQKADVIYEVGGLSGTGVIAAAKDRNQMVISVDRDKNYLAPDNVISGMIKRVDTAVYMAAKMVADGTFKGGTYSYGVKEGGIDIAPTTEKMVPAEVLKAAQDLKQMIIDGKVNPPKTLDELKSFTPPQLDLPKQKKLAFAMVTDQAGLGDQGFNDAAWEGMNKAKEDFKADISVVESREQAQYVPNFSTLAEQKTDLIVGVGFLLTNAVKEVAPQYPDTHFAVVDAVIDAPNVASLVFKENEGSFLVGAIAGMMTKTNKVGFVGGMESDLLKKFEAGYKAGVMTTNPKAEVLVSYVGSFADPAKGKEMANAQYDQKADVIYEVGGLSGTGVIAAAKDRNQMVISVDRDKNYLAPDNVISGMIKRVDTAVYMAAKMVADGTFKGGTYSYGVKEGGIDIAPTTEKMVPAEVLKTAQDLKQMIIDGKVNPPKTLDELKAFTPPALN